MPFLPSTIAKQEVFKQLVNKSEPKTALCLLSSERFSATSTTKPACTTDTNYLKINTTAEDPFPFSWDSFENALRIPRPETGLKYPAKQPN